MTPKELPRIILKRDQNMLREADKVRTVLIMFAGMFLMATPVTRPPPGPGWRWRPSRR